MNGNHFLLRIHRMIRVKGEYHCVWNLSTKRWVKYGTKNASDILYKTLKYRNPVYAPTREGNPKKRICDDMMDIHENPPVNDANVCAQKTC